MTQGPAIRGKRGPKRSSSPPDQRDSSPRMSVKGRKAAPGPRRRIAVQLDEGEGQEEEGAAQGAVEQQGQEIDPAEVRRAKQAEGHHRRRASPLLPEEGGQQHHADGERAQDETIAPAEVRGGDQAIDEAGEPAEGEQRAPPIEMPIRHGIAAFRYVPEDDPKCRQGQDRIDQEDHPPGPVIDQPAAEERREPRGKGGGARPDADGPAALALLESGADEGQRTGDQESRAQALGAAGRDQQEAVRGAARSPARSRRRWRFRCAKILRRPN